MLFSVKVVATNTFQDKPLASIEVTSNYLIEYNITEQLPIDLGCDLVERSMKHCHNLYMDKVEGTYLDNDTITIPPNVKEDCMKQKSDHINNN